MAKFKVNENTRVDIDDNDGTVHSFEEYVDEIEGVGRAFEQLETTVFSDAAPTHIVGMQQAARVVIRGPYDDTADEADAILRERLGNTTARTVTVLPDGTRSVTFEGFCVRLDYLMGNKGPVRYEAEFVASGAVTIS